jgi:phosphoribosyl 1,2-cyclic phosphodiesterase
MLTFSLQSGSNGNAIYVEANGVKLLFDAGISGAMAQRRMAVHGRDVREVDAVIISHEHRDHIGCAGIYQRKFGPALYLTRPTHKAASKWYDLGKLTDVRYFRSGQSLTFPGLTVHTIPTAHDAVDGVGFVVECDGKRLGILTDLGHPFPGLQNVLESLDAVYLESNYDPAMLSSGPYPPYLKARITGRAGHLSNEDAAELVRACGRRRPRWVAAAHLSEQNNEPELALAAHRSAVGRDYPVHLASRYETSEVFEV